MDNLWGYGIWDIYGDMAMLGLYVFTLLQITCMKRGIVILEK